MNTSGPSLNRSDIMTTRELTALGETTKSLTRMVAEGSLLRLTRGIYVSAETWKRASPLDRFLARHVALYRTSNIGLTFSHTSAAALHGLSLMRIPQHIHITTPQRAFPNNRLFRAHTRSSAENEPQESGLWGLPVTPLARTAVDSCMIRPLEEGLTIADQALRAGADQSLMSEMVEELRGRRGVTRARRAVQLADPRSESVAETQTRLALTWPTIPTPTPQFPVLTREGVKYLDFAWEQPKVGLEVDGRAKYFDYGPTDQAIFNERHREKLIVAEGWTLLRTDWAEVTQDPDGLRRRVAKALLERGRDGG